MCNIVACDVIISTGCIPLCLQSGHVRRAFIQNQPLTSFLLLHRREVTMSSPQEFAEQLPVHLQQHLWAESQGAELVLHSHAAVLPSCTVQTIWRQFCMSPPRKRKIALTQSFVDKTDVSWSYQCTQYGSTQCVQTVAAFSLYVRCSLK